MILEIATLHVKPGHSPDFEKASPLIASIDGHRGHELRKCLEVEDQYVLLVHWQQLEDHTVGFRQSPQYQEWRRLLHHFYDPFPSVLHYEPVV
jgi:heme-degrading monooxygenase HmoA